MVAPLISLRAARLNLGGKLLFDGLDLDVQDGDRFLLCSDGLSRLLSDEELKNMMGMRDQEESVHQLIHMALTRGAPDNVTVISVQVDEGDDEDTTVVMAAPEQF